MADSQDPLDANNPLLRSFVTSAGPRNDLGVSAPAPASLPPMPPIVHVGHGTPYGPSGTASSSPTAIGPVPTDTSPAGVRKWVLDRIYSGEAHSYNTIYTPPGSAHLNTFSSFADHPRVPIPIPGTDKYSTAAGKPQFLASTWDSQAKKLGLHSFSPDNQDTAAWDLAQTEYKNKTGRDISADAVAGKLNWQALAGQWPSLARGPSALSSTSSFADGAAAPREGQDTGGGSGQPLAAAPGPVPSSGPQGPNSALALALLQNAFPKHQFTPVDYDPYKFMPKLT